MLLCISGGLKLHTPTAEMAQKLGHKHRHAWLGWCQETNMRWTMWCRVLHMFETTQLFEHEYIQTNPIFSSGHTLHRLPKIATFWNEEGFLGTGEDGFCSHFWPGCFANRVLKSATLAAAQGDNICSLVLKEETITSHKHCFTLVCCRTWALDACNSTDHKLPSNQVKFHQGGAKESDVRSLSCHGGQAFTFVRQRWR